MITLKADNRPLSKGAKYSYLSANYSSGSSSVVLVNSNGFAANDYILFGEWGQETAEIVKVSTVTAATHTLALSSNTIFAHSQDTKITIIKYNQVKWYQTAATTFSATENPLGTTDIQADSLYTVYQDTTNTTGYGWFVYYNATTAKATTNSNAIPYANFSEGSVKRLMDAFFSQLNNKERNLVSNADFFRWLNEGYARVMEELNLVNNEYGVQAETSFTLDSTTTTATLATGLNSILSVTDGDGDEIDQIEYSDSRYYNANGSSTNPKYYIRGGTTIGIVPTPSTSTTYYYTYLKNRTELTSMYDNISLPNDNYFILLDFLLYRAADKVTRFNAGEKLKSFQNQINVLKLTSFKQGSSKDSFSIDDYANV